MKRLPKKTIIIAGVILIILIIAAVAGFLILNRNTSNTSAGTQQPMGNFSGGRRGQFANGANSLQGKILQIQGNTIILDAGDKGQRLVNVDVSTTITGSASSDKQTVATVGNTIVARGSTSGDAFAATDVNVSDPTLFMMRQMGPTPGQFPDSFPAGGRPQNSNAVIGKITAVSDNTITVQTLDQQTKTIDITDAKFTVTKKLALTDLKPGDNLRVVGATGSSTVAARFITVN